MSPSEVEGVSPVGVPFSLLGWIDDHADELQPPVGNKVVWKDGDFIFMIIGGPNARNDFHIDPADEIFYQLRGDIRVDLIDGDGVRRPRRVREGEVMLVPAGVPHAPMRPEGSRGLVIERPRAPHELDTLRWYCESCGHVLHETTFHVSDIETELAAALAEFNGDADLRTCDRCGTVLDVATPFSWESSDPVD